MNELSREARAVLSRGLCADGPSREERQRVKARLLALMGSGTLALGGAASAATAGPLLTSGAIVTKGLGVGTLLLWFGAGAALGVGMSGAVAVVARRAPVGAAAAVSKARPSPRVPRPATPAHVPQPALAVAPNSASQTAPVTAPKQGLERIDVAATRGSGRPPSTAGSDSASNASPPAAVSTLSEEAALLQRAQRALAAKDPALALESLGEHERRFAHGALAEEREAAKVLALCALGRVDEARALARAFVNAAPRSVLVPRLEQSCAAGN